jgi:ketosteroid isomerase-like protein
MPSQATLDAFIALVVSGAHDEAIARYYTDDATMQENQQTPRAGRDLLVAGEQKTMARFTKIDTECLGVATSGDTIAIRWRFTFTPAEGPARSQEEVAWQTWRGELIARETFFYDPAQMRI